MDDYRLQVLSTCPDFEKEEIKPKLIFGALGLAGETGEVVDLIKKVIHHGKDLDRTRLIEELGDVCWYLEFLAYALDTSVLEIKIANIAKLKARYPNGFKSSG